MDKPTNLVVESYYLQGATKMLLRILEDFDLTPKSDKAKEAKVYAKAMTDAMLKDRNQLRLFLENASGGFYDWKKDKKGKLVSCKFMFVDNARDLAKLRELQKKENNCEKDLEF